MNSIKLHATGPYRQPYNTTFFFLLRVSGVPLFFGVDSSLPTRVAPRAAPIRAAVLAPPLFSSTATHPSSKGVAPLPEARMTSVSDTSRVTPAVAGRARARRAAGRTAVR